MSAAREHAVGHLMYSRMWNHFLADIGLVSNREPYRKLVNQGMIQGRSNLVYRVKDSNTFVSHGLREAHDTTALHVDVGMVENDVLDIERFKAWREDYRDAEFLLEDGVYRCGVEIEKMSKRWFNVVNPDEICDRYGADSLRLYEMFLGPIDQAKPWDTRAIDGVHRFLKKLWKLFHGPDGEWLVVDEPADEDTRRALHVAVDKVRNDIDRLAFNTAISAMMVAVNAASQAGCRSREVLEPLVVLVAPFAPHIAEQLWHDLGHEDSVVHAAYPDADQSLLVEDTFEYPVSVNGKLRDKVELPLSLSKEEVESAVLARETIAKWTDGKAPKRVIVVPGRIVNVVV